MPTCCGNESTARLVSRPASWPSAEGRPAWLRRQYRVSVTHPVAKQRPGLARVDDVLDSKPLSGTERAAYRVQPGADLRQQGCRVVGSLQIGTVGSLDPALDGQRSPVG